MKWALFVVLFCSSLMVSAMATELADASTAVEQVILVLWHGLTWEDTNTWQFDAPMAWGFLNTRSGGGDSVSGAHLSIGAGARAVGFRGAAAFSQTEAGQELYRLHTGLVPGIMVQPDIALIRAAQRVNYRVELGGLGSALAEAGQQIRVLGNSDGSQEFHWAALVGMDGWGRVWEGSVGPEFALADPSYPYGIRTDYERLAAEALQAKESLVVVDLGDPYRYDQYQNALLPTQQEIIRARTVDEGYAFLGAIAAKMPPQTVLLLVSPHPSQSLASQGYWLTPVLCLGLTEGLLISGTTRWAGLITNMDVAPTILKLLQVGYDQFFVGRPAMIQPSSQVAPWLENMAGRIRLLSERRGQVLRGVVISQILIYSAVLISLILSTSLPSWAVRLLQVGLLLLLVVPLSLLLWDWAHMAVLAAIIGLGAFSYKYTKPILIVGAISLGTVAAISVDVLGSSWLMRYSFLGYDPIGGARFYGLGNEFMGVLVGAAIMGWTALTDRVGFFRRCRNGLGFILFAGLVVIIGAPSLGANVGGAISAIFGFGATWLALGDKKLTLSTVLILTVLVGSVLGVLMFVDGSNPASEQSHIGQTVQLVAGDGLGVLLLIIKRKLEMNFKLLRYSIWSRALIVALVGMGASFIWPSKFIFWLRKTYPLIAKGIGGVVIGSIAALVFNDSGVVAAATCLSFGSSTLLLLALELKHNFAAS